MSPSPVLAGENAAISAGDLLRYRVMAYATGVLLLVLCFVHLPLKYGAEDERLAWVAVAHGWLYVLYLLAAGVLAYRLRWQLKRTLLVLLAGTVPFASFVAERGVVRQARPAVRTGDAAP